MTRTETGLKKKQFQQVLFVLVAAILCFIGPTYLVAIISRIIPQVYAMILGFICFLVGIFFVFLLLKVQ